MRGIYGLKKESYLVHERSWDYPSDHEDMYHPHHDNTVFNENRRWHDRESHEENGLGFNGNRGWDGTQKSHGWCGLTEHRITIAEKKHLGRGQRTSILRPPLGSEIPPRHHQNMREGSRQGVASRDEGQYFRGESPLGSVRPPGHNTKYGSRQAAGANRDERQYFRGEGPLGSDSMNPPSHNTTYGSWKAAGVNRDERQYFRGEGPLGSDPVSPPAGHNTKYGSWQGAGANRDERQYFCGDQGPLGSVNPPSHNTTDGSWWAGANRDERQSFRVEGPTQDSMSNSSNKTKWTEASRKYGGYDHDERLREAFECLIKGLNDSGLGDKVKKIEVIEYERTTAYGGGLRVYQKS